jgi:hypothetical protein
MRANEIPASSGNVFPSADAARAETVLALYRKAFAEFTDEEMAILDGVNLESAA